MVDFEGLTADPCFGQTPAPLFLLQPGSPAINAGVTKRGYYQDNVASGKPERILARCLNLSSPLLLRWPTLAPPARSQPLSS